MEEFLGRFKWSRCQKDSQRPFCLWEVFLEWFPLWFHRSRFELISDSVLDLEQLSRKKPTNPNAHDSVSLGLWLAVWDHVFSAGWSNTFDRLTACVKLSNKSFLWFPSHFLLHTAVESHWPVTLMRGSGSWSKVCLWIDSFFQKTCEVTVYWECLNVLLEDREPSRK